MGPETNCSRNHATSPLPATGGGFSPLMVADTIHVLNSAVHRAMAERDDTTIAAMARKQLDAGAQALAVNLGPGKKMDSRTTWVVDTIRRFTEAPLFFSANIMSHRELLRKHGERLVVNAVTANPAELSPALELAEECGNAVVVLLVRSGHLATGIDARIGLGFEVMEQAKEAGLPLSRLYLDPVLSCRPDPMAWHVSRGMVDIGSAVETIRLLRELDRRVKTIVALGNGAAAVPKNRRSSVQGALMSIFAEAGVDAVLCNCLGSEHERFQDLARRNHCMQTGAAA